MMITRICSPPLILLLRYDVDMGPPRYVGHLCYLSLNLNNLKSVTIGKVALHFEDA